MFKVISAVAVLSAPCLANAPVELVYKYESAKPMKFEMVHTMNQAQTIQGMESSTDSSTTSFLTIDRLKKNEDGSVLIQSTTDRVVFSMTAPGTNLEFDSSDPTKSNLNDPNIAAQAESVGTKVQMLLAQDGTVLDIPNISEVLMAADEALKGTDIPQTLLDTEKDAIIAANQLNYRLLPSDKVEIGDQWHRDFDIPVEGISMSTSMDLTLDAIKDGIASISIVGTMSMDPLTQDGFTTSMKNGVVTGSIQFNIKEGIMDDYSFKNNANIEASMTGMPTPIFTATLAQSTTITRLDE